MVQITNRAAGMTLQFRWNTSVAESADFYELVQTGSESLEIEWVRRTGSSWRREHFGESSRVDLSEWAVIEYQPPGVNADPNAMSSDINERLGLSAPPLPPLNGEDPIGDPPDGVDIDFPISLITMITVGRALLQLYGFNRTVDALKIIIQKAFGPGAVIRVEDFSRDIRNLLSDLGIGPQHSLEMQDPDTFFEIWPQVRPQIPGPVNGGSPVQTPFPTTGDPIGDMVLAMTVSTWTANGIVFHRLSDGRIAVRKKTGVWSIWRPKKPTVIYAQGPNNINDVLKADAIIDRQMKKAAKALRRRGWKVSRS